MALIALFLCCLGLINPNAAALSLAPFTKNDGSAAALMGELQMGLGALASVAVSFFPESSVLLMPLIMSLALCVALVLLTIGKKIIIFRG
ncbi:hypothetical protein AAKU52_001516 [Pedobacter sp. CG_S7]|uniref:hypothetical protein n=1 Tax=Pedobacter sp. CG_S7 TaxID=3143930 RepID=UPI003399C439